MTQRSHISTHGTAGGAAGHETSAGPPMHVAVAAPLMPGEQ
jgi:hypothetical protein